MIRIAIATHKGGTGKTVTAISLAAALARGGFQTLLVDLDPQGHSTLGVGVGWNDPPAPASGHRATLRDLLVEPPISIRQVIRQTAIERLLVVPSYIGVERPAQALYMRPRRDLVLRRALETIVDDAEFVVIDCPPSLGPLTENGIVAADRIVIPCQMEARAADGLVDLLELVAVLKGPTFDAWRIVITKFDARRSVTNAAILGALEPWRDRILKTVIPQSEPLNQAQIEQRDVFAYAPTSKGAMAYLELRDELLALGVMV